MNLDQVFPVQSLYNVCSGAGQCLLSSEGGTNKVRIWPQCSIRLRLIIRSLIRK